MTWVKNTRVGGIQHVKEKRKEKQNQNKLKVSACKKISRFFSYVNKQLADPTFIQSLSYDSQAVEASRATRLSVALPVLFIVFSVLFMFAPLMKQCENFIPCMTF